MARTDEAMRRAGALAAVAAAGALVLALFPAPVAAGHRYVVLVLTLFVAFLLGCAAVVLSPAHRAVAQAARRAAEILAVPWRAAAGLRWVGFTGMVCYAVCLVSRPPPPALSAAAKEEVSVDKVNAILPFLVFLAGVSAVNLSMLTGRGSEPAPPPPPAAAAVEEQLDGGEVNVMLPSCACP